MNDFATKRRPTATEYLAATDTELLDRLNINSDPSEIPFIQSVIAARTAKSQRETNEALVNKTMHLVYATWAICAVTLLVAFISFSCK